MTDPIAAISDLLGTVTLDLTALPAALVAAGWLAPDTPRESPMQLAANQLQEAYEEGHKAAQAEPLTPTDPAHGPDCWVPVLTRWRHVRAGDVVVGPDGDPWMVVLCVRTGDESNVVASVVRGETDYTSHCDPDETVAVLVGSVEANALVLACEQLGGRVVDRTV